MSNLYIVMYHYTRELKKSRYPGIKGLELEAFRSQIEYLNNNFNIITMEEVIAAYTEKYELPEKALLLTFDDGYIDNFLCAFPVLESYGLQGSFFIPGRILEDHKMLDVNKIHYILESADIKRLVNDVKLKMDFYRGNEFTFPTTSELWNEFAVERRFDGKDIVFVKKMLQTVLPEPVRYKIIDELFKEYINIDEEIIARELYINREQLGVLKRNNMYIGLHGYNHGWLGDMPKEQMQGDIARSLDTLDDFIDKDKWVMNFPYGSYNYETIDYISTKGAVAALTIKVGVTDILKDSVFELPRLDCNDFPPISNNFKLY